MNSHQFTKRLKSSAKWSVISRFGTIGGSLLGTALLSRALAADMGDYLIVYSTIMLMTTLALSGLPLSVLREMRLAKASRESDETVDVVNHALAVLLVMFVLLGSLFSLGVWLLGGRVYGGLFLSYLPQVLIWFWAASANWLLGEIFRGYSEFRWAALLEGQFGGLGTTGGFLAIAIPWVWVTQINVSYALWLQAIIASVSAILGFRRLWTIQPVRIEFRSPDFRQKAWLLFLGSMPIALTNLTSTSMWYLELLLAGVWLPRDEIALYGVASQLTRVVSQPLRLVNQSVLPFVTDLHMAGDRAGVERLLRGAATLATALSLPLLLAMLIVPGTILEVCYGDRYANGGWVLSVVAVGVFVSVCVGGAALLLIMTGHQTAQMRLVVTLSVLYLCVAPFVFRSFGLPGLVGLSSTLIAVRSLAILWLAYSTLKILTIPDWRLETISRFTKKLRVIVLRSRSVEN